MSVSRTVFSQAACTHVLAFFYFFFFLFLFFHHTLLGASTITLWTHAPLCSLNTSQHTSHVFGVVGWGASACMRAPPCAPMSSLWNGGSVASPPPPLTHCKLKMATSRMGGGVRSVSMVSSRILEGTDWKLDLHKLRLTLSAVHRTTFHEQLVFHSAWAFPSLSCFFHSHYLCC